MIEWYYLHQTTLGGRMRVSRLMRRGDGCFRDICLLGFRLGDIRAGDNVHAVRATDGACEHK